MSTLEFQLTAEDYGAFSLHHALSSEPALRQQRRVRINVTVAVLAVSLAAVGLLSNAPLIGAAFSLIGTAVVWFIFPWSWRRALRSTVYQMSADDSLGRSGRHVLITDEDGLVETGVGPTVSVHWDGVKRVDVTPEHVFVYVGPNAAFIVPRTVGQSRIDELLKEIEAHRCGPAGGSPLIPDGASSRRPQALS